MVFYGLHDALVKPMPAGINTPSLAESFTQSKVGLTYEFVIRKGVRFHNGEPVTATDVKYSFDRYKGAGAKLLKERVREIQIVDPARFQLRSRAGLHDLLRHLGDRRGLDAPKAYVEKVGDDGFKGRPSAPAVQVRQLQPGRRAGAGGVDGYWRKAQHRRLCCAVAGDHARGRAQEGRGGHRVSLDWPAGVGTSAHAGFNSSPPRNPGDVLARSARSVDPKSPWDDPSAAGRAPVHDCSVNQAETLGFSYRPAR
jgi:peptide/nickel transport system substrate-binding protein